MPSWINIVRPKKNAIKRVLITILICLIVLAVTGFQFGKTDGNSMEPTTYSGDLLVMVDSWSIKPGDMVMFKTPKWEKWPKDQWMWCKRIDHVNEKGYWLLGDNVEDSYDSRHFGYVNRTNIYKKVVLIIHL